MIIPVSASEITSSTTGFTNIHFSNGYIGFCIDRKKSGSVAGDTFTSAKSTSVADNNIDGSDISQQLKVMLLRSLSTNTITATIGNMTILTTGTSVSVEIKRIMTSTHSQTVLV